MCLIWKRIHFDAGAYPQGHLEDNQGQGDQDQRALNGQIQALYSFPSS